MNELKLIEKKCLFCDNIFQHNPLIDKKYCNKRCKDKYKNKLRLKPFYEKPCEKCGTTFKVKRDDHKYCSDKCREIIKEENIIKFKKSHRDHLIAYNKKHREENIGSYLEKEREYYKNNKKIISTKRKTYRVEHKEEIKIKRDIYRSSNENREKRISYSHKLKARFGKGKNAAKRRGIEWDLTFEQFVAEATKPCYYCGNKLGKPVLTAVGLDRKINEIKSYNIDNIVSCCKICNRLKGWILTMEETKAIVEAILNYRENNIIFESLIRRGCNQKIKKIKSRYNNSIRNAIKRDINFTLTIEEYEEAIKPPCYYCNNFVGKRVKRSIGLDRIDCNKDYELGNVVSCCFNCNMIKGEEFSAEETKYMIYILLKFRKIII